MTKTNSTSLKELNAALDKAVTQRFPAAVTLRRHLHQHPELAFQEHETGNVIATELKALGYDVKTGVGRTGVVGTLRNGNGPVIAVRSDMDALPVTEETGLPFASRNPGVMHACGHDSHMASVANTAAVLAELRDHWQGTVRFIFQPSEEEPPGGAIEMIADGVLRDPDVDMIFGLHVDPWIPTGKVGVKDGPMMAQVDDFDVEVTGQSGHGARPHLGNDAIYITSQVIDALQSIASRRIDPLEAVVVTLGTINGGTARNVLSGSVSLRGTLRTLNAKTSKSAKTLIEKIARGTARAHGGDASVQFHAGYPALNNKTEANNIFRSVIRETLGRKAIVELTEPMMGGEDFAYFLQNVPGAMMRVGVSNKSVGSTYAWHHPRFTIDEEALSIAIRVMAGTVIRALSGEDGRP
ncbi:MAG: amidohydrolase [candidate division Zixibacteria bacterium]|nr:amidohydrolase [candidate division Zixibacteria bacterium]